MFLGNRTIIWPMGRWLAPTCIADDGLTHATPEELSMSASVLFHFDLRPDFLLFAPLLPLQIPLATFLLLLLLVVVFLIAALWG